MTTTPQRNRVCRTALVLAAMVLAQRATAEENPFGTAGATPAAALASATGLRLKLNGFEALGEPAANPAPGQVIANPALGWSGQFGSLAAVQGFVGQNLGSAPQPTSDFYAGTNYGLDLRCPMRWPIQAAARSSGQQLHLFVNARGGFRYLEEQNIHVPTWKVMPGIEWRYREVLRMRLGGNGSDVFSCTWRY